MDQKLMFVTMMLLILPAILALGKNVFCSLLCISHIQSALRNTTSTKIQYVESTKRMYLKTESEVPNTDLAVLTE